MGKRYVIDSFALLAYLQGEAGAELVEKVLKDKDCEVFLCTINLGEVYYVIAKERGEDEAEKALLIIEQLPIRQEDSTKELTLKAARIKAKFPVAYADAFVAAMAQEKGAVILTGDPDFEKIEGIKIEWHR